MTSQACFRIFNYAPYRTIMWNQTFGFDAIQFTSLLASRPFFSLFRPAPRLLDAIIQCPLCAMKRNCVFTTRPPWARRGLTTSMMRLALIMHACSANDDSSNRETNVGDANFQRDRLLCLLIGNVLSWVQFRTRVHWNPWWYKQ